MAVKSKKQSQMGVMWMFTSAFLVGTLTAMLKQPAYVNAVATGLWVILWLKLEDLR